MAVWWWQEWWWWTAGRRARASDEIASCYSPAMLQNSRNTTRAQPTKLQNRKNYVEKPLRGSVSLLSPLPSEKKMKATARKYFRLQDLLVYRALRYR
jgi:hypothetical protein